jgi:gliding motility-associated-like protein
VDETRRVYIPTVFSPNRDGINDYFYFQSPDPGTILSLQVFDRWGNQVFEARDIPFNNELLGWNGNSRGERASPGSYVWQAAVSFVDGKVAMWSGDVSIIE